MNTSFFDGLEFVLGMEQPRRTDMWQNHPIHYGIQYSHDAPVHVRVDGRDLGLFKGPHAFLTLPGHVYDYGPVPGHCYHHAFLCTGGPRIAKYLETGLMADSISLAPIPIADGHRFLTTLRDIFPYVRLPSPPPPRAVLMLEDLLLQMHESREHSLSAKKNRASQLASLEARLLAHPEIPFNFQVEATRLGLTLSHFRRIFRQTYGIPPQQFLLRCRLQHAAELLNTTNSPIKEIAERCGFENSEYFTRLFHQKFHASPKAFRNMRD